MNPKTFFPNLAGVATFCALVMAGCTTPEQRDLMMEEAASARPIERPVAMRGDGTFLAGKLTATATVRRGFERVNREGKMGPPPLGAGKKQMEEDDVASFSHVYFGGVSDEDEKAAMQFYMREAQGMRAAGSPMPPVTLRVLLNNHGPEPMEVEVTEVSSDLGNFAPRPATLTIAPGDSATLDPMISQLGVTSDDIPLKLSVRTGGQSETQVVSVRNIISAAAQKQFEELQKTK